MTRIANADRFAAVADGRRFGRTFVTKDLSAIAAVVLSHGDVETLLARVAVDRLRIVGPFPSLKFGIFHLFRVKKKRKNSINWSGKKKSNFESTWRLWFSRPSSCSAACESSNRRRNSAALNFKRSTSFCHWPQLLANSVFSSSNSANLVSSSFPMKKTVKIHFNPLKFTEIYRF